MTSAAADRTALLDDAWQRYNLLRMMLIRQRGDGTRQRLIRLADELGTTAASGRREDTLRKTRAALDAVELQIERQSIIELFAAFEATFRSRIPTAIGEAGRVVREHYQLPLLAVLRESLVRTQGEFRELKPLLDFVAPASTVSSETLSAIRSARNDAAHGLSLNTAARVRPEQVYRALHDLISAAL